MTNLLPRLRRDIDVMPSPIPDQPGLLMRDPFLYTDHVVKRQAQLNLYVHYFQQDAVSELVHLRREVVELRHRLEALEAREV